MAEQNTNTQPTEPTEPTVPETQPVATEPGTTPPQAANVDVEAIIAKAQLKAEEAASKKMEGVFKSMLEQQGLDAETIAKMTEEWKAKQVTPESAITELTEKNTSLAAEKKALEDRFVAMEKGIPAELADKYVKLAET